MLNFYLSRRVTLLRPRQFSSTCTKNKDLPRPSTFVQDEPHHENAFSSDPFLRRWMMRTIHKEAYHQIEPDLLRYYLRLLAENSALHLPSLIEPVLSYFCIKLFFPLTFT